MLGLRDNFMEIQIFYTGLGTYQKGLERRDIYLMLNQRLQNFLVLELIDHYSTYQQIILEEKLFKKSTMFIGTGQSLFRTLNDRVAQKRHMVPQYGNRVSRHVFKYRFCFFMQMRRAHIEPCSTPLQKCMRPITHQCVFF